MSLSSRWTGIAALFFLLAAPVLAENSARVDRFGDPLPACALTRLGTVRFSHGTLIRLIRFDPTGRILYTAGWDDQLRYWDMASGREIRSLSLGGVLSIDSGAVNTNALDVSQNGEKLLRSDQETGVVCVDLATGQERKFKFEPGVHLLALSHDGKKGVLVCDDAIRVIDTTTGRTLHQLALQNPAPGQSRSVFAVGVSPTAETIAFAVMTFTQTGEEQVSVAIWRPGKGKPTFRKLEDLGRIRFSPDGKWLVLATDKLTLCDADTGKPVRHLQLGQAMSVSALAFSPDSRLLAVASDLELAVFDLVTSKKVFSKAAPQAFGLQIPDELDGGSWQAACFSPDGSLLAIVDRFNVVRFLDTKTWKTLPMMDEFRSALRFACFSPDGKRVATSSSDGTLRLWNADNGDLLRTIRARGTIVSGASFVRGGRTILLPTVSGNRSQIDLYDTASGKHLRTVRAADRLVVAVFPLSSGRHAVLAELPSPTDELVDSLPTLDLAFWDLDQGRELWRARTQTTTVNVASLTPDERFVVAKELKFADQSPVPVRFNVLFIELVTGKVRRRLQLKDEAEVLPGGSKGNKIRSIGLGPSLPGVVDPSQIICSPDGANLALVESMTLSGISVYSARSGKLAYRFQFALSAPPTAAVFSKDSKWLVAGAANGEVAILDAKTGRIARRFYAQRDMIHDLKLTEDGTRLLTVGGEGSALIWDMAALLKLQKKTTPLSAEELKRLWQDLAAEDPQQADRAVQALVDVPQVSLPFLKERLKPARSTVMPKEIEALVASLDDKDFQVRQNAMARLAQLEEKALPVLRKVLESKNLSLEAKRRVEKLAASLQIPLSSSERLRAVRAVEVLEMIGTQEALDLLQNLSTGEDEFAADA
ncbi:MAG: hypothetical protein KatS3mg105_0447 [Gemmatales bacterium]|nr:MAG: hypothetical protein KatS3mg105_0447 [Gemmatales bacterium]